MPTLILSENRRTAQHFAGLLELRGRDFQVATSGRAFDGLTFERIYIDPTFWVRRDRHTVMDAVRRSVRKRPDTEVLEFSEAAIEVLEEKRQDSESTRAAMAVLAEPLRLEEEANPLVAVEGLR